MLTPILEPFHRPVEAHRGYAHQHVFRIELAADAEPASDMGFEDVDRGRRALEHAREQVAIAMWHFGGAMQLEDVARRIIAPDRTARLERHAGMASDRQFELNDHRCCAQDCVNVAVALTNDTYLGGAAGEEFDGLSLSSEQDRQFLDFERDKLGRVFRHIGIIGENRSDRLAHIPHLFGCEHRLAIGFQRGNSPLTEIDRRHVGYVGCGPHRDDSGQRERSRGVDRDDFAVGVVGANKAHVQLVRK